MSQRYCGPCFRLARWFDDHREMLEQDFVMLKIDDFRDLNGIEIAKRLTLGKHHGVPFHAIFEADESMLVDSAGNLGNIGHPSGYEGKKHMRKMLETGSKTLTPKEVDQLVDSLED
ncbi:MAG: thioredoxin family protein [Pirellulaceae bacterium]|nr:thioredoxin family protein [Pirellulaceae bacterium]